MRKTKEVLRMKFELGLGLRQIARSCSLDLGTIHEYLHRAKAAGAAAGGMGRGEARIRSVRGYAAARGRPQQSAARLRRHSGT